MRAQRREEQKGRKREKEQERERAARERQRKRQKAGPYCRGFIRILRAHYDVVLKQHAYKHITNRPAKTRTHRKDNILGVRWTQSNLKHLHISRWEGALNRELPMCRVQAGCARC